MKGNLIFWMVFTAHTICSQNPTLRIFVDASELKDNSSLVSLTAKIGNKDYSILNPEKTRVVLTPEIDVLKIESLKFILGGDTIVFSIDKLVSDADIASEIVRPDVLELIFHSLKRWDLHVDRFKYYVGDKAKTKEEGQRKNCYKDYKIYALRTINWKYYVVKL
jgi:hypothetical protein